MANPILTELAGKVPALVKAGIKGLSDDDRLGLTVALVEGGRMTFSEMKAKYGLNSSTLSGHLTALQKGDLIRNYYEKNDGRAYSYYEATDLPKVMLSALFISIRKMKVVESQPTRTREYNTWASLHGGDETRPNQPVSVTAETQVSTLSKGRSVVASIFNNATKEAQYNGNVYWLGSNAAGSSCATVQGVHDE